MDPPRAPAPRTRPPPSAGDDAHRRPRPPPSAGDDAHRRPAKLPAGKLPAGRLLASNIGVVPSVVSPLCHPLYQGAYPARKPMRENKKACFFLSTRLASSKSMLSVPAFVVPAAGARVVPAIVPPLYPPLYQGASCTRKPMRGNKKACFSLAKPMRGKIKHAFCSGHCSAPRQRRQQTPFCTDHCRNLRSSGIVLRKPMHGKNKACFFAENPCTEIKKHAFPTRRDEIAGGTRQVALRCAITVKPQPRPQAERRVCNGLAFRIALDRMSSVRGRSNANERGSSYDRRARRLWLVSPVAGFGGDGVKVPCWECGKMLTADDVIPDRKIPGEYGGTYRRSNIRGPHCRLCSCRQGARRTWEIRKALDPYDNTDHCKTCGAHYLGLHASDCPTPEIDGWALTGT